MIQLTIYDQVNNIPLMVKEKAPEFPTSSPINVEKFKGQNKTVYQHLVDYPTITVFDAISKYSIYHLHSRISDLRNKGGVIIYDRFITDETHGTCKEYSLKPFKD